MKVEQPITETHGEIVLLRAFRAMTPFERAVLLAQATCTVPPNEGKTPAKPTAFDIAKWPDVYAAMLGRPKLKGTPR